MEVTRVEQRSYIKIAVLKGRNSACDFDLIPKIKEPIHGRWFAAREDIANAMHQQVTRFTHGAANAEADGIQRLPHRWQRVVTVAGDYMRVFRPRNFQVEHMSLIDDLKSGRPSLTVVVAPRTKYTTHSQRVLVERGITYPRSSAFLHPSTPVITIAWKSNEGKKNISVQQEMAFPNRTKKQQVRTEIKDILDSIISICEEKDEETYCTEKDDILDTLEEILVAIDTQLMPSAVNSDFEVKTKVQVTV
ncbi:uncharacterized protein TNCV_4280991 [Trichonephila clavipes]|nr:uncharacterized protein TNCV_4280991 [Trichonephila clavipes]